MEPPFDDNIPWAIYINCNDEKVVLDNPDNCRNMFIEEYQRRLLLQNTTQMWICIYSNIGNCVCYRIDIHGNIVSRFPRSINGIYEPSHSNILISKLMFDLLYSYT